MQSMAINNIECEYTMLLLRMKLEDSVSAAIFEILIQYRVTHRIDLEWLLAILCSFII